MVFFDTVNMKYIQHGVVHGAIGECGNPVFDGIYARIEDPEVYYFIKSSM